MILLLFLSDGKNGPDQILLAPSLSGNTWSEFILQLVPSWNEKSVKLLHKKVKNLITILFLTSQPAKIEQMMKWMEYKKRQISRELYILPLQNSGLIAMTNPEMPNDPEQKYVITEKGEIFLGGR